MPLKSYVNKIIEIMLEDLRQRIKDHESGESPLFPVAVEDYKNDIEILNNLINPRHSDEKLDKLIETIKRS